MRKELGQHPKIPMPIVHKPRTEREWLDVILGDAGKDILSHVEQNIINKKS